MFPLESYTKIPLTKRATLTVTNERRFKTGILTLYFLSSLSDGKQAEAALLTGVLGRGCVPYPSMRDIDLALEELYDPTLSCRVYRGGETRITALEILFPEGHLFPEGGSFREDGLDAVTGGVFDILFSLLLQPLTETVNGKECLRRDLVEMEKENLIAAIKAEQNDKQAYALHRCLQIMCKDEAYGNSDLGRPDDIEKVSAESLTEYYHLLLSKQKMEIFYTGSLPGETVAKYLTQKLQSLPQGYAEPPVATEHRIPHSSLTVVEDRQPAKQGKLCLGLRFDTWATTKEYPAFLLYRELLSASPISKLFMDVREKKQLCYYCSAMCDGIKGILIIAAGIENQQKEPTVSAIRQVLRDLREGSISEEEFSAAKKSLIGSLRELFDNPGGMAAWLLKREIGGTPLLPSAMIARIETLTPANVQAVAKRLREDTLYFMEGQSRTADHRETKCLREVAYDTE